MVVGLMLVAATQYACMSTIDHVLANHSARYITTAIWTAQMALVGFAVIQFGPSCPRFAAFMACRYWRLSR